MDVTARHQELQADARKRVVSAVAISCSMILLELQGTVEMGTAWRVGSWS